MFCACHDAGGSRLGGVWTRSSNTRPDRSSQFRLSKLRSASFFDRACKNVAKRREGKWEKSKGHETEEEDLRPVAVELLSKADVREVPHRSAPPSRNS